MRRHEHATRAVELTLHGRRHVQAPKARRVAFERGQLVDLALELFPRPHRIEMQTRVEQRGREHEARVAVANQNVAEARGQADAAFGVDAVNELPAKHDWPWNSLLAAHCLGWVGLA